MASDLDYMGVDLDGASGMPCSPYNLGYTDTPFLATCQCPTRIPARLIGLWCPSGVLFFSFFFFLFFFSLLRHGTDAAPTQWTCQQ